VKCWALAHLLANGNLAHILLFGGFLAWAIADFAVCRRRDRLNGVTYKAGAWSRDVATAVAGALVWAVFVHWGHALLIGVDPMALVR
jgi:uncharacterized membrane protein